MKKRTKRGQSFLWPLCISLKLHRLSRQLSRPFVRIIKPRISTSGQANALGSRQKLSLLVAIFHQHDNRNSRECAYRDFNENDLLRIILENRVLGLFRVNCFHEEIAKLSCFWLFYALNFIRASFVGNKSVSFFQIEK